MVLPITRNIAAYSTNVSFMNKPDIIYKGMNWKHTPLYAIKNYPVGATSLEIVQFNVSILPALYVNSLVEIGKNPYLITAFSGYNPYTITISGGLIEDMDWTLKSRSVQSLTNDPQFQYKSINTVSNIITLKCPPLWSYREIRGCVLKYSSSTKELIAGQNLDDWFRGSSAGEAGFGTTTTPHSGAVGEPIILEEELPNNISSNRFLRGQNSFLNTESDFGDVNGSGFADRSRDGTRITRPVVVPFTLMNDPTGQPYTESDLVGVWISNRMYGVPARVPAGYIAVQELSGAGHLMNPPVNPHITLRYSVGDTDGGGQPKFGSAFVRTLTQTTFKDLKWVNYLPANSLQTGWNGPSFGSPMATDFSVGYRSCQIINLINADTPYEIGYVDPETDLNAVVLYTGTLAPTATVDLGTLHPPIGIPKKFFFNSSSGQGVYTINLAPRVDIPIPWNALGCETYAASSANLFVRGAYHPLGTWPDGGFPDGIPLDMRVAFLKVGESIPSGYHDRGVGWETIQHDICVRCEAISAGTYTLAKTGTATSWKENFEWLSASMGPTLAASATSISIDLALNQARFFRIRLMGSGDVISLA